MHGGPYGPGGDCDPPTAISHPHRSAQAAVCPRAIGFACAPVIGLSKAFEARLRTYHARTTGGD